MINPFSTTFGKLYNYDVLSEEYQKFLIRNASDLQYEFVTKDVELVFITGKNDVERDLSVLNHPLYVDTGREKYIFVDIRPVVRNDFNIINGGVSTQIRDVTNYNVILIRTMLMVTQLENLDELRSIKDSLAVMFSKWIARIFTSHFALSTFEPFAIEAVCSHYYRCLLSEEEQDETTFDLIKKKISVSKVPYFDLGYVNDTLKDININPKNTRDLIDNIKKVVNNDVLSSLDVRVLSNAVDRSWYGMNYTELLSCSLEDPYTFAAIAYEAINNNSHKRSILSGILKDRSTTNAAKTKEFSTKIDLLKKEFVK